MPAGSRKISFTLNAREVTVHCAPTRRLLDILRQDLGLTLTREGCGNGECGACLVVMDGNLVNACLVPAFRLPNAGVVTLEGLSSDKELSALAEALAPVFRCGYCASGVMMALFVLLQREDVPSDEDLCRAVSGNRCDCGSTLSVLAVVKQVLGRRGRRRYVRKS
jgi:aerobic-type carbon monoxide dehydrogenase small subunit (CoxS/CutS family)